MTNQIKSQMEMYNLVMKFIDNTKDIELLKDILLDALNNSNYHLIVRDVYVNYIEIDK